MLFAAVHESESGKRSAARSALLPLLGGERTYRGHLKNDVNDPQETSGVQCTRLQNGWRSR
jgi:hypothetical protein